MAYELCLLLRLRAQPVIYVAGNEVAPRHLGKQGKQRHGIPSAADSGKDGTAGAEKLRRLLVKMVWCQRHAAASEAGKRGKEKPANKKPRFPERKRGWKTVGDKPYLLSLGLPPLRRTAPKRFWNLSMRPSVSTNWFLPVKNGWESEATS